jgi:hypothetical protein
MFDPVPFAAISSAHDVVPTIGNMNPQSTRHDAILSRRRGNCRLSKFDPIALTTCCIAGGSPKANNHYQELTPFSDRVGGLQPSQGLAQVHPPAPQQHVVMVVH